jgi:hypothetical protein
MYIIFMQVLCFMNELLEISTEFCLSTTIIKLQFH